MEHLSFEHPMRWPSAVAVTPRTSQRADHGFVGMSLEEAIRYIDQELGDMGARGTLSIDVENPTVERLRKQVGSRSGACLYIRMNGKIYILSCDRWQKIEHNLYALHLALRGFNNLERWGIAPLHVIMHGLRSDVVGIKETPVNITSTTVESCIEQMGLGPLATLEDAVAVYHRRAKQLADDADGLVRLNLLMHDVREYFAKKLG